MADPELIRRIKESVDIVDIIGEHVNLKAAGNSMKGLSPFNSEKTPSFFVRPDRQTFSCFSSNKYGDVVDFISLIRGFSFHEALVWLADKGGVKIPRGAIRSSEISDSSRREFDVFKKLNRYVAHFFQAQFAGEVGTRARKYAQERGISEKMIKEYGIGFAPDSWSTLRDYLLEIKAPMPAALKLGVLKTKSNEEKPRQDASNVYDTFRNRLMFPIRDNLGEIVGFGGRTLGAEKSMKYYNSPESPVYNKGRILYNLDRAKRHIRESEEVILVEGYMDCLALDQAGFPNVVANLGTALTSDHVKILLKAAKRVVVIYDSDDAGKAATIRNMNLFLQDAGFPVSGVSLPSGKDPDDYVRDQNDTGVQELRRLIHEAPAILDQWIIQVVDDSPKSLQGKMDALSTISKKVAQLAEPIWIRGRVSSVASLLNLDEKLVLEAFLHEKRQVEPSRRPNRQHQGARKNSSVNSGSSNARPLNFEGKFLGLLISHPKQMEALRSWQCNTQNDILQFFEDLKIREIMQYLMRPLKIENGETNEGRINDLPNAVDYQSHEAIRAVVYGALTAGDTDQALDDPSVVRDALQKVRTNFYNRKILNIKNSLKEAETRGRDADCMTLQKDLDALLRISRKPMETING